MVMKVFEMLTGESREYMGALRKSLSRLLVSLRNIL